MSQDPSGVAAADLLAALAREGIADASADTLQRAMYSSDASLYRVVPQAVVRPRSTDELVGAISVARSLAVPVTMRGAGTSIAGNAVGPGLVVDTSRWLDRVLEVDPEARTARVQPGVVHASLQRAVAVYGLRFGPDPSTHTRCTIGGMIGNNACGSRALGWGRTSDNVAGLEVVWGSGEVERLTSVEQRAQGRPSVEQRAQGRPSVEQRAQRADVETTVSQRLLDLAAADLAHVRTSFGRFSRQVSGYAFEHLLPENGGRVDRFLVGSEGTLAVVLEATVELVPDVPRRFVVLGFASMVDAADAVPGLLAGVPEGLVACEGLDSRIVDLVRAGAGAVPELPRGAGWLFVETTGEDVPLVGELGRREVTDPAEAAALWRIREAGAGLAARSLATPAYSGWEDAAVPPERLGSWLRDFDALLDDHGLQGVPYGHFGDGCVHVRIDFPFTNTTPEDGRRRFRQFLLDSARALKAHGGSLSGEHGDGRARSELLPLMYDERSLALFAAAKHAADPDGVLNPGVLIDPAPLDADLRPARPRSALASRLPLLAEGAHRCTGVGACVSGPSVSVMCPSWQATRDEKDSTRGRARVLQEALDGSLVDGLDDPAVQDALDLCLSCRGCATACPTGVDMASYKSQVLDEVWSGRRRPRSHYTLGRLPLWLERLDRLPGAGRLAGLASGPLARGPLSAVVKRAAGVDVRRSLPPVASRRSLPASSGGTPDVWLWADSFSAHLSQHAVRAAIDLLAGHGLRAEVVPEQACCGLTWESTGQRAEASRRRSDAERALSPYLAGGVPVVGLEPSCLVSLRDAGLGVESLAELVTRLDLPLPDLADVTVVAQPHCHQASIIGWDVDEALLGRAGATVVRVGGCCGLAGDFGMEPAHHDVSVAVAETQLLPAVRAHPGAVVLADGFSCRYQLDDLAGVRAVTLAELLLGCP